MKSSVFYLIENRLHRLVVLACALLFSTVLLDNAFADRYVLIVGNNSYPNFPPEHQLSGCESDARLLQETLIKSMGIPEKNIRMVLGRKAKRKGILDGLDWLGKVSKPGDSLMFYYSGHGSQVKDENGDEEDGLDEVLCSYDFKFLKGRRGQNGIVDDELNEIINSKFKDREFVAIYDCCHSGTGLRSLYAQPKRRVRYLHCPPELVDADDFSQTNTRGIFGKKYIPPAESDADVTPEDFVQTRRLTEELGGNTDSGTQVATGKTAPAGAVLIAAARANELAAESVFRPKPGAKPEVHGILTLEVCRYLQKHDDPESIRYADLRDFLDRPIEQGSNIQHPQVEVTHADILARSFLGGVEVEPEKTPAPSPTPGETKPTPRPKTENPQKISPIIQATEPEEVIRPIRVAFKRYDYFMDQNRTSRNFDEASANLMMAELESQLAGMADMISIVPQTENYNHLIVYGAEKKGPVTDYRALLIDRNLQVAFDRSGGSPRSLASDLMGELRRSWIATNLMRIRQPINSAVRLSLEVGDKDTSTEVGTRGMMVSHKRARFKVGEKVAFLIRPSHDGYLTLINIDSQGGVAVIYPNSTMRENPTGKVRGGEVLRIPSGKEYYLEIQEPVGKEVIKAFLTPEPLTEVATAVSRFDTAKQAGQTVALMRGLGQAVATRSAGGGQNNQMGSGKLDFSQFNKENWAEAYLEFTTSR
ncbi:MAG: caspase family protein [Candidatus Sumerlaeia bacterium]